jgi:hypothetical protein
MTETPLKEQLRDKIQSAYPDADPLEVGLHAHVWASQAAAITGHGSQRTGYQIGEAVAKMNLAMAIHGEVHGPGRWVTTDGGRSHHWHIPGLHPSLPELLKFFPKWTDFTRAAERGFF